MKLINRNYLRQMLGDERTPVLIAASSYFRQMYPTASDNDLRIAQAVLLDCISGESFKHDCCSPPLYDYVRTVVEKTVGNSVQEQRAVPSAEQSAFVFNLIETLIFRTRGERAKAFRAEWIEQGSGHESDDPLTILGEAIALLEATKGAFKSKLVAEAKEKLQALTRIMSRTVQASESFERGDENDSN